MFDPRTTSAQRWSALFNGLVVGLGVQSLIAGFPLGAIFILVGVGLEVWQRRRYRNQ